MGMKGRAFKRVLSAGRLTGTLVEMLAATFARMPAKNTYKNIRRENARHFSGNLDVRAVPSPHCLA
jgi:hypothetical protein